MAFNPSTYTPETEAEIQARENRFLISEGRHVAIVTEASCTKTKNGGYPAVVLTVEIINGTDKDKGGDKRKDSKFNYYCDFPDDHKAASFGDRKMYSLWEVSGKGKWDTKDQALTTAVLVGKRCIVEIVQEEFNGKTNSKIDTMEPLNAEQKERFPVPDKWKTGNEVPGGFSNDDIPF